jgi:hypothetical protein
MLENQRESKLMKRSPMMQSIIDALGRDLDIDRHSINDLRAIPDNLLADLRLIASKVSERNFYLYMRQIIDSDQAMFVEDFIEEIILTDSDPKKWEAHQLVVVDNDINKSVTRSAADVVKLLSGYGEISRIKPSLSRHKTSPNACGGLVVEIFDCDYRDDSVEGTAFSRISDFDDIESVNDIEIAYRRYLATRLYWSISQRPIGELSDNKMILHHIFPEIHINDFSEDAIKAISGLMVELKQGVGDGIPGFIAADEVYR